MVLLAIQYTTRPLAKLPNINMKTHGIHAKIICCVGSVGAGFNFCCNHIEIPRMIGKIPIKTNAVTLPASGAPTGRRPNKFINVVGSGADKS